MIQNILNKRMAGIQHQGFPFTAEHAHIHAVHGIHLHHILHSSALLGNCEYRRNLFIFQLFDLNRKLLVF